MGLDFRLREVRSLIDLSLILCTGLLFFVTSIANAKFEVSAPGSWVATETSFPGQLFAKQGSKQKEMILIFERDFDARSSMSNRRLTELFGQVAVAREERLDSVGLTNYNLFSAEARVFEVFPRVPAIEIESSYVGYRGQTVMMVERQYYIDSKIYNVAYSIEASVISDRGAIRRIMDQFRPSIERSRLPASDDSARLDSGGARSRAAGDTELRGARRQDAERRVPRLDGIQRERETQLSKTQVAPGECSGIPIEQRRTEGATGGEKIAGYGGGCALGVVKAIPAFFEGVWSVAEGAWSITSNVAKGAWQYASDSKYRASTNVSAALAFEAAKDPGKMAAAVFDVSATFISKSVKNFVCLNEKSQGEVVCKFFAGAVVGGVIFKTLKVLLYGGKALTAAESVETLAQGAKEAERIVAELARPAPGKAGAVVSQAEREQALLARQGLKERPSEIKPAPGEILADSQRAYSDLKPLSGRAVSPNEATLQSSKIMSSRPLGTMDTNLTESHLLTFENGKQGVWKPHVEQFGSNYRAEVLAYEVDRKLGIDLVPETVERVIDGKKGSVQLFKVSSGSAKANAMDLRKQQLLDFLIDNRDRHAGNFLKSPEGRVISIDHGLSFTGKGASGTSYFAKRKDIAQFLKTDEGKQILSKIKSASTDAQFKADVRSYLGAKDTDRFMKRLEFLLKNQAKEQVKNQAKEQARARVRVVDL